MDLLTIHKKSQLVKHMLVNDIDAGKHAVIDCITGIERWCRSHGLKLNADKSDMLSGLAADNNR